MTKLISTLAGGAMVYSPLALAAIYAAINWRETLYWGALVAALAVAATVTLVAISYIHREIRQGRL